MADNENTTCDVCFRHCVLSEGQTGFCRARRAEGGRTVPLTYGKVTSLALDPIEKKPLDHYYPGSNIVSAGGYGCNLACPFCQNAEISLSEWHNSAATDGVNSEAGCEPEHRLPRTEEYSPKELAALCESYRDHGNIGIAFTYNEPLICYEYILDTAKLIHERSMKVVLVTNGSASLSVLERILPHVDAMNIDLKSFDADYYKKTLKGDLETTKAFIEKAAEACHVEITTLLVPRVESAGDSNPGDSPNGGRFDPGTAADEKSLYAVWDEEMEQIATWLSEVGKKTGKDIPLHVTRFFPRSCYAGCRPTPVETVFHMADIARKYLKYVHEGNV